MEKCSADYIHTTLPTVSVALLLCKGSVIIMAAGLIDFGISRQEVGILLKAAEHHIKTN